MKTRNTDSNRKIGYRILNSALIRIIGGLILVAGVVIAFQFLLLNLFESSSLDEDFSDLLISIVQSLVAIACYVVLYRIWEKRKIRELSLRRIGRNLALGLLIGFTLQTLTISIIYFTGSYKIISFNGINSLIPPLTMALTASIFEEIIFRGIIFRLIEEKLGSYIALIISALIFGGLHLLNPNSSIVAAVGLALQAGVLLGAAYILSRNLWLPIALHFAWNFTQSGIYGASTSGNAVTRSIITSEIDGPAILSGGQFGPEGSLQATLFCLTAAIIILVICRKQGKIIKPIWSRG